MTEIPIEVGYRSYIKLLRKKWDIVYYGKDLYFSHANKILEPYYDPHTKEFYGVETNPTRLAIVKFLDQFREGPGLYEVNAFPDLLKHSVLYYKRVRTKKPFRFSQHQESHPSLKEISLQAQYENQDILPRWRQLEPGEHETRPYQTTFIVEEHPNEKMVGKLWTHIYVPSPADHSFLDNFQEGTGYSQWVREVCEEDHDLIIVEPLTTQFYLKLVKSTFSWGYFLLKLMYINSILLTCRKPYLMRKNLFRFGVSSLLHLIIAGSLRVHPLGKYKIPDRFHDTEALAELKYFREILPVITAKNVLLYKDEKGEVSQPLRKLNMLHFINLFVLLYNYMYGSDYWFGA